MSSYRTIYNNAKRQFTPVIEKKLDKQVREVVETGDCNGNDMNETIRNLHGSLGTLMAYRTEISIRRQVNQKGITPQKIWRRVILLYLEHFGLDKLTREIGDTTKEDVLKILQSGVVANMTIPQILAYIKETGYTAWRAELIARTETAKAANTGSMVGALSTGLQTRKEWISVEDSRTRVLPKDQFDHFHMDKVQVDTDAYFNVPSKTGTEQMLHPGDPNGSAANVINCRCTVGFTAVRDSNGVPVRMTSAPIGNAGIIYNLLQAQNKIA